MICNQLVMATLLQIPLLRQKELSGLVLLIRRGCIIVLLLLGYIYYRVIGDSVGLVSIGLVSFAAVAQLAPPLMFGIFWKGASCRGAIYGLSAGFLVWAIPCSSLLLPVQIPRSPLFWRMALSGLNCFAPISFSGLNVSIRSPIRSSGVC